MQKMSCKPKIDAVLSWTYFSWNVISYQRLKHALRWTINWTNLKNNKFEVHTFPPHSSIALTFSGVIKSLFTEVRAAKTIWAAETYIFESAIASATAAIFKPAPESGWDSGLEPTDVITCWTGPVVKGGPALVEAEEEDVGRRFQHLARW